MRVPRLALLAAALAGGGLAAACTDVPFAPKWDADWTVPLPVQPIQLTTTFPASVILPGMSGSVAIPPQTQPLSSAVGKVLGQEIRRAIVTLNYTMPLPLTGVDTLFVAANAADLTNPAATRIVFRIALAQTGAAGVDVVDTLAAGSPELTMLQDVGKAKGTLYVQIRGSVRNPGATPVTLTASDVIGLSLQLTARIAMSR